MTKKELIKILQNNDLPADTEVYIREKYSRFGFEIPELIVDFNYGREVLVLE